MDAHKPSAVDPTHDLAIRIYVELVAKNTEVADGSVKMAATPANIAALSLKLSEAFLKAEADAKAAKEPVKDYKLAGDDIASWGTK